MSKIERKYIAHYIDCAAPEDGDVLFVRLGAGLEEYSPEMSAQVEKKRNILGQTDVMISGYEKTAEVATYYADPDTELFGRLQNIIENGTTMDSLGTRVVDVQMWRPKQEFGYYAVLEHAYIEVKSYGGDATGYQIPFTIHFTGEREIGYFNPDDGSFIAEADM